MGTYKNHTKFIGSQRSHKHPRHYDEGGAAEPYHPPDVKQHDKQLYFQSVDSAIATIENHFQQKDYKTYSTLEQLVIKAVTKKDYYSGGTQRSGVFLYIRF